MYSEVAARRDNELMSIRHIGEIRDGVEQPLDERTKAWSGGFENYTLTDQGGATLLDVNVDAPEDFAGYFEDKFPQALADVKRIAEASA